MLAEAAKPAGHRAVDQLVADAKSHAADHRRVGVRVQHRVFAKCALNSLLDRIELLRPQRSGRVDIDLNPAQRIVDQLIERGPDGFEPTKPGFVVDHQKEPKRQVGDPAVEDAAYGLAPGLGVDDPRGEELSERAITARQLADLIEFLSKLHDLLSAAGIVSQLVQALRVDLSDRVGVNGHGSFVRVYGGPKLCPA